MAARILLVDDDLNILQANQAALERAGYEVVPATCVREALRKPDLPGFSLVISDVMMEERDAGFILCHRLKSSPATEHVPVMLLSSAYEEMGIRFSLQDRQARRWIKADALLNKPITPEALVQKVRDLLARRQAQPDSALA